MRKCFTRVLYINDTVDITKFQKRPRRASFIVTRDLINHEFKNAGIIFNLIDVLRDVKGRVDSMPKSQINSPLRDVMHVALLTAAMSSDDVSFYHSLYGR